MIQKNTIRCLVLGLVVLAIPRARIGSAQSAPDSDRFSKEFASAAIETLGSMREWATNLGVIIKKGYPVGHLIEDYKGRTMKDFALANSAASNDADRNGLQLLTYEYNNLMTWSDLLVKARSSMNAANYTMSPDALLNDPASQKVTRCWKFLGPMFASGKFKDDGSCR